MTNVLKPLERAPLLYVSVQDAIRTFITENNLQPGDPLPPESELARQLDVGRNSVREGLKSLEALGLVEIRRGTGIFVRSFSLEPLLENLPYAMMSDLKDLEEIFEIRRVLEDAMIDKAVKSMPVEQLTKLQQVVERMGVNAEAGVSLAREDREFHQLLFEHLDNKLLLKLLDLFWFTFRKVAQHFDIDDSDPMRTYQGHASILQAVEARDTERVRQELNDHHRGFIERLAKAHRQQQSA